MAEEPCCAKALPKPDRPLRSGHQFAQGKTQAEVAALIAAELDTTLSKQAVNQWESFKTQPSISHMAAWCRVLGLRLRVEIVDPRDDRIRIPVRQDSVEPIERFEALDDRDRKAVIGLIRTLSRN